MDGIHLITKAYEKRSEEKAFQLYLMKYQNMTEKNYMPFSEFYKPKKPIENDKTADEILDEVKSIIDDFRGGGRDRNI